MSEFTYIECDRGVSNPYPRHRIHTGPEEVLVGDIKPGDVVRMIHEYDPKNEVGRFEDLGVVLEADPDKDRFRFLSVGGSVMSGWRKSSYYADRGMKPYDSGTWNPVNHTQSTGESVSTHELSRERAIAIRALFDRIASSQAASGVVPNEPTLQNQILDAFVEQAISGKQDYFYDNV